VKPAFNTLRHLIDVFRATWRCFIASLKLFRPPFCRLGISSRRSGGLSSPGAVPLESLPWGGFSFLPGGDDNNGMNTTRKYLAFDIESVPEVSGLAQ
jgi:hypothetical protein